MATPVSRCTPFVHWNWQTLRNAVTTYAYVSAKTNDTGMLGLRNQSTESGNAKPDRFPIFVSGKVVKGFGRGSKELGIPTANMEESVVETLPKDLSGGVFYGWAQVDGGYVHKMVTSVGWNPYFKNEKKSLETHIMHRFEEDFIGSELKIAIAGSLREQKDFPNQDALVAEIMADIAVADRLLEAEDIQKLRFHKFFKPMLFEPVSPAPEK